MATKPVSATLRAYQVGFGDCLLLTFHYSKATKDDRHLLIDFGSTGLPKNLRAGAQMLKIAQNIKSVCNGNLTGIVATHRHRDHISGFATNKQGTAPGDVIASCKPKIVIQPWTEDPKAQPTATSATTISSDDNKNLIARLTALHQVSEAALAEVGMLGTGLRKEVSGELRFLGEDNLKNLSAVKNLMNMGKKAKARYVNYGVKSGLKALLPGVKVTVLGPPDLKQSNAIRKQRARDKDEFWQLQARTGNLFLNQAVAVLPKAKLHGSGRWPVHDRWMIRKMQNLRGAQLLGLVRALDDEMNNTSVILLFEIGKKKLLFPGDAQIENWSFALSKPQNQALLKSVNLYKVGHHGSLNATPKKSLWALFANKKEKASPGRLQTVVSTMPGKHGSVSSHTEVPRRTLITELEKESSFSSTETLAAAELARTVEIDLR